jgi:hypothetical protein
MVDKRNRRLHGGDNPGLNPKIIAREISANAAAIRAGFRHETVSVLIDDGPEKALRPLFKKFGYDKLKEALEKLEKERRAGANRNSLPTDYRRT